MENQICERPAVDEMLDLGMILGQNQAFGFLAGRCSAAQAETIRRLRNEKLYKRVTEHWKEFCPRYLKMSGTQADSIIRLWEEFGAGYFEIAQLTRVSPETYRALAPAVENGVLNLNGEQIELTIENSRKVAAAVSQVRRSLPSKTPEDLSATERIDRLDQLCTAIIDEFAGIKRTAQKSNEIYMSAVVRLHTRLSQIRREGDF
jgi:uncharacterized membrane protein YheB (UPF0754 family)